VGVGPLRNREIKSGVEKSGIRERLNRAQPSTTTSALQEFTNSGLYCCGHFSWSFYDQ
jgi:hypothetical protein